MSFTSHDDEIKNLTKQIENILVIISQMGTEIQEIQKSLISHENELKERKNITNNYIDSIISKIGILKNLIQKNIGDTEQFISPNLIEVQGIEEQIKQTGKISDKQFEILNKIYLKQKRIQK